MSRLLALVLMLVCASAASAQQRVAGSGSTGDAVPIGALGDGLKVTGTCNSFAVVNQTSATTTEVVALTAGQAIYVCGWAINVIGAAGPPTWKWVTGTGTNCGTGTADLTPVFTSTTTTTATENFVYGGGMGYVMKATAGGALCITSTTTTPQRGIVTYTKF
jgi:hypothetical protein